MWGWLPAHWRIPLAVKLVLLVLVALVPYWLLPQRSLGIVRELTKTQQEARLREVAEGLAQLLGEEGTRIQGSVEGIVAATSVEWYWYGALWGDDEQTRFDKFAQLESLVTDSRAISGLDYLVLAAPTDQVYLVNARDRNQNRLPLPAGNLVKSLSAQEFQPRVQVPEPYWRWAIERHTVEEGVPAGPYFVVGGPVYYQRTNEPDTHLLAGFIAGGKLLRAGMLGNPRETVSESQTDVLLVDAGGQILWSTFETPKSATALLATITAVEPLAHHPEPMGISVEGQRQLVSMLNLSELEGQGVFWRADLYLVAVQPESEFTQAIAGVRQSLGTSAASSAALAIVLALLLAAGISGPLHQLAGAVGRYKRGEATGLTAPATRDEIETLAREFQSMVVDRERALARLIQAEKLAAWRDVARKLAHEIKNPLQPIRLQVESLQRLAERRPEKIADAVPEAAEIVLFEVDRLKRLADEFAAFARMPQAILEPTPLAPLLAHVLDLIEPQHPEVSFVREIPTTLPIVVVDREKVTQALVNLVKNAVEALTDSGTENATVTCGTSWSPQEGIRIWVADNGPGIASEVREQLFTAYATTKESGSGLGLVVVQQVMNEHGGRIELSSEAGTGTRVTLCFPPDLLVADQG